MRPGDVLVALLLALAAGSPMHAQSPGGSLVLLASAGDYPGETYTQGPSPPAQYVFFVGEPVAVDVSVANWSLERRVFRLPGSADPPVRVSLWRDGQRAGMGVPADGAWLETVTGSRSVMTSPEMSVEAGDGVRWRMLLSTDELQPGFYVAMADTGVVNHDGRPIRPVRTEFTLEMRARSQGLPAELARRDAEWLTAMGRSAEARAATDALERVYPDSVVVHLIRSRLAEADGNEGLARLELDRAAAFMRADRDALFRRFARPGQIEDLVDSLAR